LKKEELGWLTRPGSQTLGAKWVEVTKTAGRASLRNKMSELKTWPATPVERAHLDLE